MTKSSPHTYKTELPGTPAQLQTTPFNGGIAKREATRRYGIANFTVMPFYENSMSSPVSKKSRSLAFLEIG